MSEEFKVNLSVELDENSVNATEERIRNIGKDSKVKVGVDVNDNGSAAKTSNDIKKVEQSAKSASSTTKSFGDTLKKSLNIGSAAAITAKGIRMIENTARKAVDAVKDVDGAITDLRMATGDSYENVAKLVKGYNDMGKALGATTTEITSAADAWLRQGNSIKDTNTLIKDSMILSKVGQLDSADATQYLTSAMKGYGVAVEDVLGIVDKLTAVDLVSATDAGGLAEAMSRTAVTANQAGVSMDKLIGYLAVTGEVTQKSMSSIGESFKTIFTRMADIKAEKLELIDEDGTVETLSQVETVLNNLGIKLRDSNNEFRNFGDVLDEVAAGWNNYSTVQRAAIGKAFAGTRQQENFRVLMENYDTARQYMETAADSAGTAEQKFGAYLDSIEAKTKSLQAAFESLSVNTFSTGMLGGIIEASTALIQFLDKTNLLKGTLAGLAAGAIKAFTTIATGISNAAVKLNEFNAALKLTKVGDLGTAEMEKLISLTANLSQSQLKAVLSAKTLTAEQRIAILTSRGMSEAEAQATLSTMGLATAEGTATATTFSLSGAVKGLWATLMANPLILVVAGVTAAVSAYSAYKQQLEETRQSLVDNGNAAIENAQSLESAYVEYMKYAGKTSLSSSEESAFQSAIEGVTSALGGKVSALSGATAGTDEYTQSVKNATAALLEDDWIDAVKARQAAMESLQDESWSGWDGSHATIDLSGRTGIDEFVKAKEVVEELMKDYIDIGTYGDELEPLNWDSDHSNMDALVDYYYKLIEVTDELAKQGNMDNDIYKDANNIINSLQDSVENYVNTKYNELKLDYERQNGIPTTIEQYQSMREAILNASEATGTFKDELGSMLDSDFSQIIDMSAVNDAVEETTKLTEEQLTKLKDTFQSNDIKEWFDSLSDSDKELVYEIGIRSDDTTLYTLTRWQSELESMRKAAEFSGESITNFQDILNSSTDEGSFSDYVDSYTESITKLQDALNKNKTGSLEQSDKVDLAMNFPELAPYINDTDALSNAIQNLIDTSNSGMNTMIDEMINNLSEDAPEAAAGLEALRLALNGLSNSNGIDFDIDSEIEKFNNLYDAMKESVSGTGLSTEAIKNVEAMYSGLQGYDPSVLFEKTEHGIHLNTTALRALESQYESIKKVDLQKSLQDLKQQYNDTKVELEGLTEGTDEYNQKMADLTKIENQINDVQTLAAQYEGLTSAYNKWIMAQSAGEEGDMYDNITSSLEDIKQLFDDGLIGTNAFRSAVQMMSNEDLSTANIDKLISTYEAGYPAMQRYFTDSSDGCLQFLKDVESLNAEWAHMSEDGNWEINFGIGNDEEIANAISDMMGLQVSTEQVQIIMRKLSDYGFDIKLDSAYTSIEDLKSRIEETEEKLKELGQDPVDINVNADDIDAEIEKAKSKIQEISNSSADVDVKTAQLDDANAKLDVLINKKIEASQPAFMSIDVSQVDSEIQGALTALQEYQTAVNNLKALEIKGADTSEIEAAKGKVDELAGKIESLPTDVKTKIGLETDGDISSIKSTIEQDKIKIPVSADTTQATTDIQNIKGEDVQVKVTTTGNEALDTLKSALDGLTDKTINVSANVTGTENLSNLKTSVGALVNKTVTATATAVGKDNVDALKKSIDSLYNRTVTETAKVVGTNLVDALKKAIDNLYSKTVSVGANVFGTSAVNALKSAIDSLKSKTVTATTVTKKVAGVDGTAHADGTAFVRGDWGTKESGVALGGELGQELVVRNGRFFTIGDKSAEFFKYQKGDIIFNAAQTKEIFEKGKITHGNGRGQALAEGTAFSSGSGRITSGGKTKKTTSGKSSSSSSKSSSSSNSKSKSSSSSEKEFEETFDWIEVAIDRMERAISQLDLVASSTYKNWSTRNKKLQKEIQQVTAEIDLQQKGYNRYIQEANSVGLDEKWAKKVRDGTIDINTVKDEDLADKIKEYQQWYDKALDCKDAIDELNETISELYETAFNNVVSEYDGILSVVQHEQNMLEEYINQTEEKGYIVSTKYYDALIKNKEKSIADMEKERTALLSSLNDAVASGAIQKNSEAWYEMVNQIDEVTLAIEEANTEIIEFNNNIREIEWEIFDILQDKISQVTKESDFLINLLSSDKLYDDRGQLTNEGRSTMGLHGLNYNVYMSQADEYAKELLKINQELAKDPYNQTLAERRQELLELQQEMILAAEDEKQAIVDMVEEGIELELDALKDLIDTYTDALDAQKALYDYQNKIEEQTGEIASLEKQKAAYEGDDSEESRAKRQEIDKSLEKARKDLEETEYDKYISDQKELLDNLYLEYETILNERLDNVDALISDMIFEINNSAISINETLNQAASSVGYTLTEEMRNIWGLAAQQMEADAARRVDDVTRLVNQLVANGQLSQADAQNIITALGNGDAQGIANATNIINQLVAQGQLSQADATNIQNTMKSTGADYKGVITTYGTDFQNKHTTTQATLDNIKANVAAMVQQANQQAAAKAQQAAASSAATSAAASGKATTSSPAPSSTSKSNSSSTSSKKTTTTSKKDRTEKEYYGVALAIWNGNYGWGTGNTRVQRLKAKGFDANKVQSIVNQMGKEGYVRSGAWVGRYKGITSLAPYHYNKFESGAQKINKDQFAWTQEKGQEFIVRPSDGAILTPVARDDSILDADASSNIWDMANNPTDFVRDNLNLDDINIPNNMMAHNNYTQNLDKVIFNLPNVKNYDELLYMMQHDRNFERLILSMTIDRLAGKSSLAKYHAIRGKSY